MIQSSENDLASRRGRTLEILGIFLRLGLVSFGGPVAHLAYFNEMLVKRRRWVSQAGYAELIALSQMLPGPSSSQVGFALGVLRGGGLAGGLAAWIGFTMPTVILLFGFAYGASSFRAPWQVGLIHGLKLVAIAVVAHAVWGMAKALGWDKRAIGIMVAAILMTLGLESAWGQIAVIVMGAAAGLLWMSAMEWPGISSLTLPVTRRGGAFALALFVAIFLGSPLLAAMSGWHGLALFDGFFRSGSLVFGGGHVVLPLLHDVVVKPGWVSADDFVAGYGVTQAMPGPVFSFAAFLGAVSAPVPHGVTGGIIALVALFLPGLLLIYGILPFWTDLRGVAWVQPAMRGVNAAVVGLLAASLYRPLWTSTIGGTVDIILALAGFALLAVWRKPPWIVVLALGTTGMAQGILGASGVS